MFAPLVPGLPAPSPWPLFHVPNTTASVLYYLSGLEGFFEILDKPSAVSLSWPEVDGIQTKFKLFFELGTS